MSIASYPQLKTGRSLVSLSLSLKLIMRGLLSGPLSHNMEDTTGSTVSTTGVTGVNNIISTILFDEFNFTSSNFNAMKLENTTENDDDDFFKLLLDRSQMVLTSVGLLANSATVITLIKNEQVSYI